MQRGALDADVLKHLAESVPFYSLHEDAMVEAGFRQCFDYSLEGHRYFEGYFHGEETGAPIDSINPRYGSDMEKPAAPRPLRAFVCAFREMNRRWLTESVRGTVLEGCRAVSDLAVQVHYGTAVTGQHLGWHRDAINSAVHLAVSLKGRRALHHEPCALAVKAAAQAADEKEGLDSADGSSPPAWKLGRDDPQVTWQADGDVYVSSPYAFMHAVEYPEMPAWEDRVIAMQARFLFTRHEMDRVYTALMSQPDVMARVTPALESAAVELPKLADVHRWEQILQEREAEENRERTADSSDGQSSPGLTHLLYARAAKQCTIS